MFWNLFARKTQREAKIATLMQTVAALPILSGLAPDACRRLSELALAFLEGKAFSRVDGEMLSDEDAAVLALQAALPVLGLGVAAFGAWREVILYPDAFITRDQWMDHSGLVHEGEEVLVGQARQDGPLVLSLPDALHSAALDGWNVVIHEMAHKLDMLDGDANGCPPLHRDMDRVRWAADWQGAYAHFCREVDAGVESWLDPYASEDPAEFFAVLSEAFFETPAWLRQDYPHLYRHLADFYRQDPLLRLPGVPVPRPAEGHAREGL